MYRQGQYSLELRGVVSIAASENDLLAETQKQRFFTSGEKNNKESPYPSRTLCRDWGGKGSEMGFFYRNLVGFFWI